MIINYKKDLSRFDKIKLFILNYKKTHNMKLTKEENNFLLKYTISKKKGKMKIKED